MSLKGGTTRLLFYSPKAILMRYLRTLPAPLNLEPLNWWFGLVEDQVGVLPERTTCAFQWAWSTKSQGTGPHGSRKLRRAPGHGGPFAGTLNRLVRAGVEPNQIYPSCF